MCPTPPALTGLKEAPKPPAKKPPMKVIYVPKPGGPVKIETLPPPGSVPPKAKVGMGQTGWGAGGGLVRRGCADVGVAGGSRQWPRRRRGTASGC